MTNAMMVMNAIMVMNRMNAMTAMTAMTATTDEEYLEEWDITVGDTYADYISRYS